MLRRPFQTYSDKKSHIKSHAGVVIRLTLNKQVALSEQGSKDIGAESGGTILTCVSHYIAWTRAPPSTARTPLDLPTPKGHVKQSKFYSQYIREIIA